MNVSSVKNLNGETFSAVQDAALTDIVQTNSGNWQDITAYQNASADYLTAHQDLSYISGQVDNKLNTTEFTAYSADQWEMSAGSGISFVNDNVNKITRIDVTAQGGSTLPSTFVVEEDGQAYKVSAYTSSINPTPTAFENGITEFPINEIGAYVYTTNIPGNGHWQLDGGEGGNIYDYTVDLTNVSEEVWNYSTKLQVQDYSWPPQEATLSTTIDVVDKTPYLLSGQGGGITGDYVSGVNWVSAQTGSGPFTSTVYYEATISGDVKVTTSSTGPFAWTYSLSNIGRNIANNSAGWNQVYDKLDTTAFDTISGDWNEAVTAYQTNSSTYLTAHQAISAEEWNDTYNNVNTNSGAWGGSALNVSAGPGVKLSLIDGTLVVSNDETVLWSGEAAKGDTMNLSESYYNFKELKFVWKNWNDRPTTFINYFGTDSPYFVPNGTWFGGGNFPQKITLFDMKCSANDAGTTINVSDARFINLPYTGSSTTSATVAEQSKIYQVVGINRIAGGN